MTVKIRYLSVAAVLAICSSALAQKTVDRQEYWIDGNVAGSATIAAGAQIDLTEQNVGPHTLTVRICDSEGVWSAPVTRYFVKAPVAGPSATAIAQCEYWIDGKVDERQTVSDGAIIPMDDLIAGPHTITVRTKDDLNVWSAPITRYFVKASVPGPSATAIAQCEYWIDGKVDERQAVSDGAIIPMDNLLAGPHTITVRIKDDLNVWSNPVTRYFVKAPVASPSATAIVQCEYWFDGNTAERRSEEDFGELVLENLEAGVHTITLRAKDDLNVWSSPVTRYFVITAQKVPAELTRCVYWFDNDAEHIYSAPLSGSIGIVEISIIDLMDRGEHTMTWAVVDSEGRMSNTMTETFYIIVDGMKTIDNGKLTIDDEPWYTLSGVKLNARPTETGIYIWKGRKMIVK